MSSPKRSALEKILPKLTKLLAMFGSDKPGERDNAMLKAGRLLKSVDLDWHDVGTLLGEREEPVLELLRGLLEKDADALVRLGLASTKLFTSTDGTAYADSVIRGNRATLHLMSSEFSDWLVHQFFRERKKAPTGGALKNALRTLAAVQYHRPDQPKDDRDFGRDWRQSPRPPAQTSLPQKRTCPVQ